MVVTRGWKTCVWLHGREYTKAKLGSICDTCTRTFSINRFQRENSKSVEKIRLFACRVGRQSNSGALVRFPVHSQTALFHCFFLCTVKQRCLTRGRVCLTVYRKPNRGDSWASGFLYRAEGRNSTFVGGGVRIHPENARKSGRHGVQYVAKCVACAALTLDVWQ